MLVVTVLIFKQRSGSKISAKRVKQGVTNIDIGCMQLNFRWHKKVFQNLSDMMSPEKTLITERDF